MSAHTPGPWVVRRDEWDGFCVHAPIIESQVGCTYRIVCDVNGDETPNPTYGTPEANARLIAAAPELLEALILLEHEMVESGNARSVDYGWKPAISKTRAAIVKATGEQA